jgi:heme-degrading monooxygenase HmoA
MPVLEILQLQLAPGVSPDDPTIIQNMVSVRTALRERVYNTNSRCYQCIEDPTLIYIFGIWPDLETHQAFIDSPLKSEILALQQDQTKFKWMLHIELDDIKLLPFDAPVMNIAKLHVKTEHVTEYYEVQKKHEPLLVEATKPYNVVTAWRCDSEDGKHEYVVLSGWESVEAHEALEAQSREWNKDAKNWFELVEAVHAKNMES